MNTLHKVKSIEEQPELVKMMASYVSQNKNKVCGTCGLQVIGHSPESLWLGYSSHDFNAVVATEEQVQKAYELSCQAYRQRTDGK